MLVCGAFVNGPYALITTAVSADLGSHPSLKGDLTLTATVTGACMKFFLVFVSFLFCFLFF